MLLYHLEIHFHSMLEVLDWMEAEVDERFRDGFESPVRIKVHHSQPPVCCACEGLIGGSLHRASSRAVAFCLMCRSLLCRTVLQPSPVLLLCWSQSAGLLMTILPKFLSTCRVLA